MPTIIFLRHGQSTANVDGVLAGRTPGIELTTEGRSQIAAVGDVLPEQLAGVWHSRVQRCVSTAAIIRERRPQTELIPFADLDEVDYGGWTGRKLAELKTLPEWSVVSNRPSRVEFPGGESLAGVADRVETAVRSLIDGCDADDVMLAISHGDIIRIAISQALGMPLDDFQRIAVSPGSLSTIVYGDNHPVVTGVSVTPRGLSVGASDLGGGDSQAAISPVPKRT